MDCRTARRPPPRRRTRRGFQSCRRSRASRPCPRHRPRGPVLALRRPPWVLRAAGGSVRPSARPDLRLRGPLGQFDLGADDLRSQNRGAGYARFFFSRTCYALAVRPTLSITAQRRRRLILRIRPCLRRELPRLPTSLFDHARRRGTSPPTRTRIPGELLGDSGRCAGAADETPAAPRPARDQQQGLVGSARGAHRHVSSTPNKIHPKGSQTNKPNKVKRITYGRGYGGFSEANRCGITDGRS